MPAERKRGTSWGASSPQERIGQGCGKQPWSAREIVDSGATIIVVRQNGGSVALGDVFCVVERALGSDAIGAGLEGGERRPAGKQRLLSGLVA